MRNFIMIISLLSIAFKCYSEDPRKYLKLHALFRGENLKNSVYRAIYLDKKQRKKYELKIIKGRLYTQGGSLFDTGGLSNSMSNYVLSKDGKLYSSRIKRRVTFEHSSYVAGEDVICAGTMKVVRGKLLIISDMSAQYVAHAYYNLDLVIKYLKEKGVDTSKVKKFYWGDY